MFVLFNFVCKSMLSKVKALQGLCYLLYVYSTENESSMSMSHLELEMCSKWLVDNKLSLHTGKTECIIFGSKGKLRKLTNFSVR